VTTEIVIGSGPKNARTDPQSGLRLYTWQGRELPSVTSIRRLAGMPHGLHQWSIGKVIDYALNNLPSIVARVADAAQLVLVRSELRKAATAERDAAAKLGIAVHDAAATGKSIVEVGSDVAPRLRQYLDFLAVSGAEVLASEFQCWNLTVGYAGTADLLVRFPNGRVYLVDLKTGKGVYTEHALQLAAYLMAEFVGSDDVVDERLTGLLRSVMGMGILHLADDHWEYRALEPDAEMWRAFRGLVAFATWMHEHPDVGTVTLGSRRGSAGD